MTRLLLFLAFALAPLLASAHGGHHGEPAAPQASQQAHDVAMFSPACPPGPGHLCSCGNLDALSHAGGAVVDGADGRVACANPPCGRPVQRADAVAQSLASLSIAQPRAPPR